jgi:hypothetical protein
MVDRLCLISLEPRAIFVRLHKSLGHVSSRRLTELAANVSLCIGFARAFEKRTGRTVFD